MRVGVAERRSLFFACVTLGLLSTQDRADAVDAIADDARVDSDGLESRIDHRGACERRNRHRQDGAGGSLRDSGGVRQCVETRQRQFGCARRKTGASPGRERRHELGRCWLDLRGRHSATPESGHRRAKCSCGVARQALVALLSKVGRPIAPGRAIRECSNRLLAL